MVRILAFPLTFWMLLFGLSLRAVTKPSADVIVTNAKVWTGDTSQPRAEAMAIIGDRIVAVGTVAEIDQWRGPRTSVIDAAGRLVLPGFNDAHVHFSSAGANLDNVKLNDAASPEEFIRRIGEYAKRLPKGEWMVGGNWDEQIWPSPLLPTRQMIDAVTPDTPVFISRHDGHMALANSLALKLAGVDAKTPEVPGGTIVRDSNGNPTGILKDAAMSYVWKAVPSMSAERRLRAIRAALAHAASVGVTSVQDMGPDYDDVAIYAALADRGELTTRIYAVPSIAGWEDQAKLGLHRAFGGPYLRLGGLKGFADGSLGSTTAFFFEPYEDAPNTRGLLADEMIPLSKMRDRMMSGDAAGLQLCIHAIGDAAISQVLDLFTEVQKVHGDADRRWRIEHSQHVAPKDFARYSALGVIASVQPYHAIDDGQWAERRIGPERAKTTYAFKTFLDNGVRLAFGTDWDVAPLNPMLGIYAAVTRATLDGKHPDGWVPAERLTVEQAVHAYTMGSAYAEFQERDKGSVAPGKLADVVILSDDIFSIDPHSIKDVKVERTIVGGKVVYERK
jgi:predicted amidohydrolase YtcJ